ncbi:MAG TPA: penicillin acylase family protein [Burkholderiaceae bacterium]
MRKILKKLVWLVLALLLAIGVTVTWYWRASLPKVDGSVKLAGLGATVDIVRDQEGIPHIYAQSPGDAYFALGFAHAQDRLWQMEMNRRIASGRMAEVLGPAAVDTDRFLRTLGIARNAQAIWEHLAPDVQANLDAYAKGVNAFLDSHMQALPPEFYLTGAPAPEHWRPVDSIGWQTMMAWDLGANWTQELLRMRLSQRLSLAQINEFLPPYPGDQVLKTQDYTAMYRELAGTTARLAAVAKVAPPSLVEGMGSNNWVVSGELSETGKPLLANDPHLGLSAPALWYFAHLSAPGLNVIGATLPGIPGVVLGHNDRIAWGFTNTAPDVQDLFIERINPDNAAQYQTPEGWKEFQLRHEIIKVKGQPDVDLEVRETRHGPVITGTVPIIARAPLDAKKYAIAFQWTALRTDDLTMQAGMRFNTAANWQDFIAAAKDFGSPQQNMVYADVDGNIGFVAPGRVPVRKAENDLHGLAPAPGWDARYDWDGFIPFDALPQQFNPASHKVFTANQKIVPDDYPYFLTSEWTMPYRADRIGALLASRPTHNLESFAAMQKDVVSLAAQELLPLVRDTTAQSAEATQALQRLQNWNGEMAANLPEPLIFNAWMRELSRAMFAEKLGDSLMKDYWDLRNVQGGMVNVLKNKEMQDRWCRPAGASKPGAGGAPDAPVTPNAQGCAAQKSAALDTALAGLRKLYGADMAQWKWGDAHMARSEHRPFGKVPFLAKIFDIRVPSPGDTYTIDVGRYDLRNESEPFANRHAASLRALYDLSNLDNSQFIHSTGQSGNVMSPLYRNFNQRWVEGKYVPMLTRREAVEKVKAGQLKLMPQ